jgi:hypothetical protein
MADMQSQPMDNSAKQRLRQTPACVTTCGSRTHETIMDGVLRGKVYRQLTK